MVMIFGGDRAVKSYLNALAFGLLGMFLVVVSVWPANTMQYRGIAVDADGRIYIGENSGIGVYANCEKVDMLMGISESYEFTIYDNQIHLWEEWSTHSILDLDGSRLAEKKEIHHNPILSDEERYQYTTNDGKIFVMENRFLGRTKVVCYSPDGSEEIVFQMPLGLYLVKLAVPVYFLAALLWFARPAVGYIRKHRRPENN